MGESLHKLSGRDLLARLNQFQAEGGCVIVPTMNTLLPLLTAFGLGSIVTALMQAWLSQRSKQDERAFAEKQKAYIGLLEAYHRAAVEGTDETAKAFAYWQMRCELVAPPSVREAIARIVETNDNRAGREAAHNQMKSAMRSDLRITK